MDAVGVVAVAQLVALLCGALLGLAGVLRLAIGWLDRRLDLRDERQERRWEDVLDERLESITRELRPNGGTSLRDRVDVLGAQVTELTARESTGQGEVDRRHDEIDRRWRRNAADLARLRREVTAHVRAGHPDRGRPAGIDDGLLEALDDDGLDDD